MGESASVMANVVTNFHAAGDGVTDDSGAINSAIAAVNSAGGGLVYFPVPSVNYWIASSINMAINGFGCSNISLVGNPGWNTIIKCSSALNGSNSVTQNDMIYGVCNSYGLVNVAVENGGAGYSSGTINLSLPAPTVAAQGTPATTTYSYDIVAVFTTPQTPGSISSVVGSCTDGATTLNSTNYNLITWTAVAGSPSSINVYRTFNGGTSSQGTGLIASLSGTATSYQDQGAIGNGNLPAWTPRTVATASVSVSGGVIINASLSTSSVYSMPFSSLALPSVNIGPLLIPGGTTCAVFAPTWQNGQQNIVIQDLVLDCSNQNNTSVPANQVGGDNLCAMEFFNADYVQVIRCKIIRSFGNGIVFGSWNPTSAYPATGCRVEECLFDQCVGGLLRQYQSSAGVYGITGDCIQMGSALECVVRNNSAILPGGPFLDFDLATACIIEDNYVGGYGGTLIGSCPSCTQVTKVTSIASGGSGYNPGDLIYLQLNTGSFSPNYPVAATLQNTSLTSGAITSVSLLNGGCYTTGPSSPASQQSTTGSGSGASFNIMTGASTPYQQTVGTIHSDYGTVLCTIRGNTFISAGGIQLYGDMAASGAYAPAPGPQNCVIEGNLIYLPTTSAPPLAEPAMPTVTPTGTGSTTWHYQIVAVSPTLQSYPSYVGSCTNSSTLNTTDYNEVTWSPVSNATSYNVYRGTTLSNIGRVANVIGATSFKDTGATLDNAPVCFATPGPPTVNPMGATGVTIWAYQIVAASSAPGTTTSEVSPVGWCTTGNQTLTLSNYNQISWTAVTGATSYNIYRTATPAGGNPITIGKIANVTGTTYSDQGAAGDGTTPAVVAPPIGASGTPPPLGTGAQYSNNYQVAVAVVISGGTSVQMQTKSGGNGSWSSLANGTIGGNYPTTIGLNPADLLALTYSQPPTWTWALAPNLFANGIVMNSGSVPGSPGSAASNLVVDNEIIGPGASAIYLVDAQYNQFRGNHIVDPGWAGYPQANAFSLYAGGSGEPLGCYYNLIADNQIFDTRNPQVMLSNYSDFSTLNINNTISNNRLEQRFIYGTGYNSIYLSVPNGSYVKGNYGPGNPPSNPALAFLNNTTPGAPTSATQIENPFPCDALVTIQGGTVSSILIGPVVNHVYYGVSTGATSGTFPVRYGEVIYLSFTGTVTWVWWLL